MTTEELMKGITSIICDPTHSGGWGAAVGDRKIAALIESYRKEAEDRIADEYASLYHPEFGTEWRDDGEIGEVITQAKRESAQLTVERICERLGIMKDGDYIIFRCNKLTRADLIAAALGEKDMKDGRA